MVTLETEAYKTSLPDEMLVLTQTPECIQFEMEQENTWKICLPYTELRRRMRQRLVHNAETRDQSLCWR
jgi:hypothetical protein